MITEDYVSFETAKLLKEKDFDAKCSFVWAEQGNQEPIRMAMPAFVEGEEWADRKTVDIAAKDYINPYNAENNSVTGYLCPTLQMAMKWLREVHDLNINNELSIHGYFCSISHIVRDSLGHIDDVEDSESWETAYYDTHEEAIEDAIKYCLEKLI